MARLGISTLVILSTFFLSSSVLAKERDEHFKVNIGHFKFPLIDEDIEKRVYGTEKNFSTWVDFYLQVFEEWDDRANLLPEEQELDTVHVFANNSEVATEDFDEISKQAQERYDTVLQQYFDNDPQKAWGNGNWIDLSESFLVEIEEKLTHLSHQMLSAYAGVGAPVACSKHVDSILKDLSEYDKAGMSAATTLMALIPTFLAFGALFVPRSSEAFATSWLVGLGAALFTFGLPVRSLSCVRRKQVIGLASFDKDALDEIAELGENDEKSPIQPKLDELQEWTGEDHHAPKYQKEFRRIRKAVNDYGERWHWWHVPALFIAGAQGVIFGIVIEPLLKAGGIPRFLFGCSDTNWTGLYLSISAGVNALFRLAMWQLADHEVVKIYHLSKSAKAALESLKDPKRTTAKALPPIYPPLVSGIHTRFGNFIKKFIYSSYKPLREEHPSSALMQPIKDQLDYFKFILTNPLSVLSSGFTSTKSAPRWRPLIVLIHLSTQGRPQLRTLLTGFCEAALLLALTFFFAAQWGGNLYITAIALALLLIFITIGRALAIMYVSLSARTWGLHTINCDEQEEILGCLRIVCSMQGVLVVVNGAHYYDGYRLDYVDEFRTWRKEYGSGKFDEKDESTDNTPTVVANGTGNAVPEKKPEATVTTAPAGQDMV